MQLEEYQDQFIKALKGENENTLYMQNKSDGVLTNEMSLSIYRNNFFSLHLKQFKIFYPCVFQVLGEKTFNSVSIFFISQFPCDESDLFLYSKKFGRYLGQQESFKEIVFLQDLISFEELRTESLRGSTEKVHVLKSEHPIAVLWDSLINNKPPVFKKKKEYFYKIQKNNEQTLATLEVSSSIYSKFKSKSSTR